MRLALVGPTHPFRGGISHYTTLLCQALRKKHEVEFFSFYCQYPKLLFPGQTQTDFSAAALQVENQPTLSPTNPLSWLRTAHRIRRFEPQLIVFSWWHPFFAPAFGTLARLAGRSRHPACFLCHNVLPHESTPIDRTLLRYVFSAGAAFITHSQEDSRRLQQLQPGATVYVNPHPTYEVFAGAAARPAAAAKAALGLSDNKVLLYFGFVRDYKGLDYLLQAVEQLDPEPGYHLIVAGEFYVDRDQYQARLEALTRRGQLTLVDRYIRNEEISLYFSAADLVMVPYLSATQSGIVQIAYGFLKPVVATTVGGLPEVVSDGQTGYLVPPADAAAIAAAVRRYFEQDDPEPFRRRIEEQRHRFSWDRMVETIETAAAQVAAG